MNTLSQTVRTLIDHTLQALSAFFPGKQDKRQQQQLQSMFDRRVLSHRDIIIDPRIYTQVETPPQSRQNESPVSQEIQQQLDYWQNKRVSQSLLNRKFDQLLAQGCTTERFHLDASQKESLRKFTDPILHKTTFQPMVIEEDVLLNQLPVTPESLPIFDPEEEEGTMTETGIPALQAYLKHTRKRRIA